MNNFLSNKPLSVLGLSSPSSELEPFTTIAVGEFKSGQDIYDALVKNERIYINPLAKKIMLNMPISSSKRSLTLAKGTLHSLGLKCADHNIFEMSAHNLDFRQVFAQARKVGLELCPPEVGPILRIAYQNQPDIEYLTIAMEPYIDEDWHSGNIHGHPVVFALSGDYEEKKPLLLTLDYNFVWYTRTEWIFVKP